MQQELLTDIISNMLWANIGVNPLSAIRVVEVLLQYARDSDDGISIGHKVLDPELCVSVLEETLLQGDFKLAWEFAKFFNELYPQESYFEHISKSLVESDFINIDTVRLSLKLNQAWKDTYGNGDLPEWVLLKNGVLLASSDRLDSLIQLVRNLYGIEVCHIS